MSDQNGKPSRADKWFRWADGVQRHQSQFGFIVCAHCRRKVRALAGNQKYCSANCRQMAYYRRTLGRRVRGHFEAGDYEQNAPV